MSAAVFFAVFCAGASRADSLADQPSLSAKDAPRFVTSFSPSADLSLSENQINTDIAQTPYQHSLPSVLYSEPTQAPTASPTPDAATPAKTVQAPAAAMSDKSDKPTSDPKSTPISHKHSNSAASVKNNAPHVARTQNVLPSPVNAVSQQAPQVASLAQQTPSMPDAKIASLQPASVADSTSADQVAEEIPPTTNFVSSQGIPVSTSAVSKLLSTSTLDAPTAQADTSPDIDSKEVAPAPTPASSSPSETSTTPKNTSSSNSSVPPQTEKLPAADPIITLPQPNSRAADVISAIPPTPSVPAVPAQQEALATAPNSSLKLPPTGAIAEHPLASSVDMTSPHPATITTEPTLAEQELAALPPASASEKTASSMAQADSEAARVWAKQLEILERENQILREKLRVSVSDPLRDIEVDTVAQIREDVLRARVKDLETQMDKISMKNDNSLPQKTSGDQNNLPKKIPADVKKTAPKEMP